MQKNTAEQIDQIDYLRDKTGMSYEEATDLLNKFDGDLAQCMVELERLGRIRPEDPAWHAYRQGSPKCQRPAFVLDWEGIKRILFSRVSVRKGDTLVTNMTVLTWLFVLCAAPWLLVIGVAATFLTGCKVKWNKNAADPTLDIQAFVGQAANNIRRTASSVADAVKSEDASAKPGEGEGPQG